MGTCSSKDRIEKSVVSPPRSPSRPRSSNVEIPTTSPLPDARHEYSTVADHLPTKPKDNEDHDEDDHHPFFPHEAETPEELSARSSTDDERSNKDGKVYASAAFESSEEHANSKQLQMSAHPGSLPDDYHDALDEFGKSLTDFHILKSETNPLHESKSAKNDARPLTASSFTERKPIGEKSLEESKQEPLQSAAAPSKEAKDLAEVFATREESHRATASIAAPEEAFNVSTRDIADATEAVASIQREAKESEITPAIETSTELAAITSSAVKDQEITEHESTNVKYAQKSKITNADEQTSVSVPDLTEKSERSGTAPSTSPATDITANLPTTDSKDTRESTIETEKCDESHKDQYADATEKEDEVNGTATKGVRFIKLGCSDIENRDSHQKQNNAEQREMSYLKVCGEPAMAQTPNAALEVVENLPTQDDAMLAEQTILLQESHKKIITAHATDETMEPDVLNTYHVIQDARIGELESSHAENVITTKIRDIDQQETVLSPAVEDQHKESHRNPATVTATTVVGMLPTKENEETEYLTVSINKQQIESNRALASDVTTGGIVLPIDAATEDKGMGHESSNKGTVEKSECTVEDEQQLTLSPALEEQDEKLQATPYIKEVKDSEILNTRNNAWEVDPTITLEELHKVLGPTATDATTEVGAIALYTAAEGKFIDIENIEVGNADETENIYDEKKQDSPPTMEEQGEKTYPALATNVVTEIANAPKMDRTNTTLQTEEHHKLSCTTTTNATKEDVLANNVAAEAVQDVEYECKDIKNEQKHKNRDVDEQLNVSSPSLKENYEESDTAQSIISALEVIETITAKDNTVELKPIILQEEPHKEFNTTSVIEATNKEKEDAKVEELESSDVQDLKEPEIRSSDQQETLSYPPLVYQTEESHRSPVIVPATKVNGMFPINNDAQTTDLTITTDDKHEESIRAPDANVRIKEDALLINVAREPKGLEYERKNGENAERTESTSDEQQSVLSPALAERHEDSQTCSDINETKQVPKTVHRKENAWEADLMLPSEELHDHSHMAATEVKKEADVAAKSEATEIEINDVENSQEPKSLYLKSKHLNSPPAIEEHGQETDPALDTDGGTEIVESLPTIHETHISSDQDLKEPESRSVDQQETIPYPSLVAQTEESPRGPVIDPVTKVDGMLPTNNEAQTADLTITTDEKHKESSRAPDANVRTEEDALHINAAREAKGLEHAERPESTNAAQQSASSPALEEQHNDSQTCSDINEAKAISETVHGKENDWETDPMTPSEELHDQLHTAATERKIEEDAIAINAVEKGEARELENNNVENVEEPASLCLNKEQLHSPPAIEEQGQETEPTVDIDGVTEIVECHATINGTHISGVQDLKEPESRSIDQQETIPHPSLVYQTEELHRSPVIVPVTKVDGIFPTNNEAQTTDLPITTDEKHKEYSRAPDANVRTEEDALLINAAREAKGLEHERNNDVNAESTNAEKQSTLSPDLEEQHEDSKACSDINAAKKIPETVRRKENVWEADPVIPSEELHDQSHTEATETKPEEDAIAINGVEKGEATELESDRVENAQEPASLGFNKEQSHSPPAIEEQGQETDPTPDTDGVTEILENLTTINGTYVSGVHDLKVPEGRSIYQQETVSYPSLVYHTEESCTNPVIVPVTKVEEMFPTNNEAQTTDLTITTDEKHKESSRALDANVRTGEDSLLSNAAREAKDSENERNNDKNEERTESKNSEQQSTLSPAFEEEYEDSQTCSDISVTREIPETIHRKENTWEAEPVIPSEELHDQSHIVVTETKLEEDAKAVNGVDKSEATELENNNVENAQESNNMEIAQEPATLCINKEQLHSPPAIEEQGQETDPTLDTDGLNKIVQNLATINGTHISGIQDLTETERRCIDQQETILYPTLVEESHRSPVVPVKKVDGMFATNNEVQTTDLTITTDEKHKESSRVLDANVGTEEDALLIDVAREFKGFENERNNDKNAERTESTNAEQQSTLSPALEEQHEDSQTRSDINATKEIPETVHSKESTWDVDATISSEELHDQSHTAVTETKLVEDALAINVVEKDEATELESNNVENAQETASLSVNKEESHSPPVIEEEVQETDATLYTGGVTEIVENLENLATINGTHISGVQDLKETESRSIDQQETISYPSLVYQTEESQRSPIIVPVTKVDGMFAKNNEARTTDLPITDEKQKESSRAPDANVRTEEDAIPINAGRDARGLEHERNNDKNADRTESTNAEQQSTLSPALEEQHEDSHTCSDINAEKEIPETVHRNENAWEADPVIHSEELHDQSHTAATETKLEEAAIAINGVEEKGEATEFESNNVENPQEPASLCVNKEQSDSPPAIVEHGQETDPTLDTDGVTEIVKSLATINRTHTAVQTEYHQVETCITSSMNAISKEDVIATNIVAEDAKIMEFECKDVKKQKEQESAEANEHQSVSSLLLKENGYEANTAQAIYTAPEFLETLYTKDDAMGEKQAMIVEELHEECNITPDRDATTEMDISTTDEVTKNATAMELESNGFETVKEPESRSSDQQQTVLCQGSEQQREESYRNPAIIATTKIVGTLPTRDDAQTADLAVVVERNKESCRAPANDVTKEVNVFLNTVTEDKHVEQESDNGKNAEKTETTSVDEQPSTSSPALEEQHEEPQASPFINSGIEFPNTISTQDNASEAELTIASEALHKCSDLTDSERKIKVDVTAINGVAEREAVEVKRNKVEKEEEPESKYVDRQQSCLPAAMEEKAESDLAPATNVANEIAQNLSKMDETKTAVQTVNHHEDSNITLLIRTGAHTADMMLGMVEQDKEYNKAPAIDAVTEDKNVEDECDHVENAEKPKTTGADKQPSTLSPTLEEHEEPKASPYINAATEIPETTHTVDNTSESDLIVVSEELHEHSYETTSERKIEIDVKSINGVAEGKVAEVESNKLKKAELASKYVDKQQSCSAAAMEEQIDDSDPAPATRAVEEIPENLPMVNETTTAVQTETLQEESNITTLTDLTRDDAQTADLMVGMAEQDKESNRAPATDAITEDRGVEHGSDNGKNAEKTETTHVDEQTSTLPPALEEQHKEPQSSQYIHAAIEVPKTLYTLDNALEADRILATKELHKHSDTTSERKTAVDVTASNEVAESKVVEAKSNEEDKAEVPESKYVNKQQSQLPAAMEEQVEAPDSTEDEDLLANNIIVKVVEVAELEYKGVENEKKHENADDVGQQSISSPVLKEDCKETDTTKATDTGLGAVETFADEQQNFSSSVLKESEETDTTEATDTALEVVETFADEQKSISSSVLKENFEETGITQATVTAQEAVENFYKNDNAMVAKEKTEVKDPHKEINMTLITNATTEAGVENEKKHENVDADEQQSVASPVLEENSEEIDTTQATDTAPGAIKTFGDEQQNFSSSGLKECEETGTTEVNNTAPEDVETFADEQQSISSSILKENCEETDITEATDTAPEAVENFYANEHAIVAKETMTVNETQKEFNMTPITNATTGAGVENEKKHENADADERQSVSSVFLKENCEERNTLEATYTATKPVETFADEQKNISSSVLKENCERTNIAQDTDTAPEAVENFYEKGNAMVTKETMAVKEPHKEFNMTLITNATRDDDVPAMEEAKQIAKVQDLENSSNEIIKEPESRCYDLQKSILSSASEEEHEESHTSPVSGSTEIVRILPRKNGAQTVDLMMPTEKQHEQSNKAPATDVTIEADSLLINAVTGDGYVGKKISNVGNEKEMITTGPHEQQSTLSPALEEQHAESESSPAIKVATENCETTDTWDTAQTQMIQSEQHHEESDTTSPHETTGHVTTIKALPDDEVVQLESSKLEKADQLASIYVEKKQAYSPPTMTEQDEESNPILATNAAMEIIKNYPTKDVAQTTDPTQSSEQQFKGSDKTPVSDATKGAQSMGYVTKNIDIAECQDTDTSKQQTASFPTLKEESNESYIVQPKNETSVDTFDSRNDAETADSIIPQEEKEKEHNHIPTAEETRDNNAAMGTITKNIEVGLESSDVENLEEIDSTGTGQQHVVLSSVLEAETESLYIFPARSAETEIVEALPTGNYAKKAELMVQTEEWQKGSESTVMTDAPIDTGAIVVDVLLDDKVVEQESNNIQNVEEGESTNVYEQRPYLFPVREEHHEGSQIMSDTNALTEIAQTHNTREEAQITDLNALSEEEYEASHTTPATDPKTAIEEIAINSITVGEAVQRKGSNLENAGEPENEIADEQQRVSPQVLEEKLEDSSTAKPTIGTMEIDETTGTRNNAQTEDIGVPKENFDKIENNTEAEVLAMSRITEDVTTIGIIRSTTVEIAEANSTDVNQLSVLCQDVEEHPAVSAAVPANSEIKEIADALLTRENTWTIDEAVPIEEKHEKTNIIPATDETTEA